MRHLISTEACERFAKVPVGIRVRKSRHTGPYTVPLRRRPLRAPAEFHSSGHQEPHRPQVRTSGGSPTRAGERGSRRSTSTRTYNKPNTEVLTTEVETLSTFNWNKNTLTSSVLLTCNENKHGMSDAAMKACFSCTPQIERNPHK